MAAKIEEEGLSRHEAGKLYHYPRRLRADDELEVVWVKSKQYAMWSIAQHLQEEFWVDPADSFVIACAIEDDADHLYTTDSYVENMPLVQEVRSHGVAIRPFA